VKILVTGGAGFIGSNLIHYLLPARRDTKVVNFDKFTYAGNSKNLTDFAKDPCYPLVRGDVADADAVDSVFSRGFDAVINLAAETHVDCSIQDPGPFREQTFLVSQECSGIRSSIALTIFVVLISHFSIRPFWKNAVFAVAGLLMMPIKNGLRRATLTPPANYVDPTFCMGVCTTGEAWPSSFSGWVCWFPCIGGSGAASLARESEQVR
jgi:exosortase/archaeosortase family protein